MSDKAADRQRFSSNLGFLLSAVGSAVGLGNIWRYPYVAYKNGGGVFLIVYLIALFSAAIPMLILEFIIGSKYKGATPLCFARMKRGYEWIGWIPTVIAGVIIFYYSVILSWSFIYSVLSVNRGWGNDTETFFYRDVLHISDNPLNLGGINMPVLAGLILVWGACYFICSKSISDGLEKANRLLLPLTFATMLLVVLRGITLPNAHIGLNALFKLDWSFLLNYEIWVAAYGQVFFSLFVAMGIMITYSSYLPKNAELVNTGFIAGLSNTAFEYTIAIGVFGVLGFMSAQQGIDIDYVVKDGPGLVFIVFPACINMMPGIMGIIIGPIFFVCFLSAGFTSFISLTEAFTAPFVEKFGISRKKVYLRTCVFGFAASCLFATNAGFYILDIVDYIVNSYGLTVVGILEAFVCGWVLKLLPEFAVYANKTSYIKLGAWWILCVKFMLPFVVFTNLSLSAYTFLTKGYDGYSQISLLVYGGGVTALIIITVLFFSITKPITNEYDNIYTETKH